MSRRYAASLAACFFFVVLFAEPALAGPGGKIARVLFETFWGKVALAALTVLLLPVIVWVILKERAAARRALADLAYVARSAPQFEWLKIRQRFSDCFTRIHAAWRVEDVAEASRWMTAWYWQNQQIAHLARWEREGLRNECNVKRVCSMRPLLFTHRNDAGPHEGSMLVVSIVAHMQDYLEARATGVVVEGSKTWKDVETLWTFTFQDGAWLVSQIEEGSNSLVYASLAGKLPPIESTMHDAVAVQG